MVGLKKNGNEEWKVKWKISPADFKVITRGR